MDGSVTERAVKAASAAPLRHANARMEAVDFMAENRNCTRMDAYE